MNTQEILIDIHTRCHQSLALLLEHCGGIPGESLARELEGFGYPTILQQLHHAVGAEHYWVSVLRQATDASENESHWASIEAIQNFHQSVKSDTLSYLKNQSGKELDSPVECVDWKGEKKFRIPSRVIVRTQTHLFHHHGQVSAMCRLVGAPVPSGFDYSVD